MNNCIFCQYSCDRSDVLRKHYQRHHPTPAAVCDEAKSPRIAVIHPGNPKVAIPVAPDGKMLKIAYCWNCWHVIDNRNGGVDVKQGGMPGFVDRNHTCKDKQARPKRGPKKPATLQPPVGGPQLVVQEVAASRGQNLPPPASDDNPFKTVVLDLLQDKQVGQIIREELPDEPDSDEEEDSDVEPISSREVLKAAIFRSVKAMEHARKAAAKVEPLQQALSTVREQAEILEEENHMLRMKCAAIQDDADQRIQSIREHEAACRHRDLKEMAERKDRAILALIVRLAEATGEHPDDILASL